MFTHTVPCHPCVQMANMPAEEDGMWLCIGQRWLHSLQRKLRSVVFQQETVIKFITDCYGGLRILASYTQETRNKSSVTVHSSTGSHWRVMEQCQETVVPPVCVCSGASGSWGSRDGQATGRGILIEGVLGPWIGHWGSSDLRYCHC